MKSDLHFDGRSLVPLIKGTSDNWPERTVIIDNQRILYPRKFRKTAVMTEQYRWVNGKELYDIIKDPGQKKDIHEQHPELIKKIEAEYNDWWSDVYPDLNRKHEISIGSMEENPVPITDHDIHGKTIWLQDGVFAGKQANGYWEIFVESEGDYLTNEKGDITAVNFRLHLIKGSTRMSAWFVDGANDGEVFGVYYVYVKKLI